MVLQTIALQMNDVRKQVSSFTTSLGNTPSILATLQGVVRQLEASATLPQRKTALEALLRSRRTEDSSNSILQVQTTIQRQCRPLCPCICHTESNVSIPQWMSVLVGRLFIGYSSSPRIVGFNRKCTETICHRSDTAILKVNYYFPSVSAILKKTQNSR